MSRHAFFCFALVLGIAPSALAQVPLLDGYGGVRGFGTQCLSPNDDGSSASIDITGAFPGGLEFFGRRHTVAYVNTNGNITFRGALSTYTPNPFPVADQPMIAPYWGDVDIRGSACSGYGGALGCANPMENGVWWHLEPGLMVVTWDNVGFFSCDDSLKMSFQLILREARYCGIPGDFDVEFRYNRCEWETGDASGGEGGFGGTQAQVGFDAGNLTDFVAIPGSRAAGISELVCTGSNIGDPGLWRFRIRRGLVECPDAGELCDTGELGICGEGRTQCSGADMVCQQVMTAAPERCDALDNDCDGSVDEDPNMCPGLQVCDRGTCIDACFEGGCREGEACTEAGVCEDVACREVVCESGQRCIRGTCLSVCDAVVCPPGQTCRAGGCVDLCATLSCDSCHVCAEGTCRMHCRVDGCPSGESCEETGECVETACLGMRCGPGRVCRAGRCADACDGVVCPMGEQCRTGVCGPLVIVPPDAGTPAPDSGTTRDAGEARVDAGPLDAAIQVDGGRPGPPPRGGCGCRAAGSPDRAGLVVLALIAIASVLRRRRAGGGS